MIEDVVFNLMLGCFAAHELDAVDKKEWRILFVLRRMDDRRGRILFTLLHIPLAAIVLSLVYSTSAEVAYSSRLVLDVFAVIHLCLHWRLHKHPENQFTGPVSYGPILGAAVLGGLHACYTLIPSLVQSLQAL